MKYERPVWLNARNDGTVAAVYGESDAIHDAEKIKYPARIAE